MPSTIVSRRLDETTYEKAMRFLEQAEDVYEENHCCHMLSVPDGSDDKMILDAMLQLRDNRLHIKVIWIMEYNHKHGMVSPRDPNGERGRHAKILGEKYLNSFLDHLNTVDINNVVRHSFMLTGEVIEEVESKIDQCIDPTQITEAEINRYDRIEMTHPVLQALRYFCKGMDEEDYSVSYDEDFQIFDVEFCTSGFNFKIPLDDIVRKKWEMNDILARAAIACAGDLYVEASERKDREAHYIKQLLDLALPNLRKIAGEDQEKFEGMKNHFLDVIDNQIILYDTGREHSEMELSRWNRDEFIAQCDGLDEVKNFNPLIDMLYGAYCDGFEKSNGDTLLSGKGGLRLPGLTLCS